MIDETDYFIGTNPALFGKYTADLPRSICFSGSAFGEHDASSSTEQRVVSVFGLKEYRFESPDAPGQLTFNDTLSQMNPAKLKEWIVEQSKTGPVLVYAE